MIYKFSELIEKLIISNIKLTIFDHLKQFELEKESPDLKSVAEWEMGARSENENRSVARNAIDEMLSQILSSGVYEVKKEWRTF